MAKRKASDVTRSLRPALVPENALQQLAYLAVKAAKQQLQDGTASSQVITQCMKFGSPKEELEIERLREENNLLRAKVNAINSSEDMKLLYAEAVKAMKDYSGHGEENY